MIMTLDEKKDRMIKYRDYFGYDIMYTDEIMEAKSDKELALVLDKYEAHTYSMYLDALSSLSNLRRELGVSVYE